MSALSYSFAVCATVLILVVMEYTQWAGFAAVAAFIIVLILVVMEYTQWDYRMYYLYSGDCLNPCCNGIYSMRTQLAGKYLNCGS